MAIKKLLLYSYLILGISSTSFANDPDYTAIDQHAREAPAKIRLDLVKLTNYLVKPAKNDYEKTRSFYTWISDNIAYDIQLFRNYRSGRYQPISPDQVLKNRKAVCQGYAELFQEMCRQVGIRSYVIGGYSKGFGYAPKTDFTTADHAWNVVNINGQWHLVDVTWGSGGLNEDLKFVKMFNDQYFLADPQVFVLNHLPLAPMWQLLDCPIPVTVYVQGDESIQRYLEQQQAGCSDFREQIDDYEGQTERDKNFYLAQMAYEFNPKNPVVLARAYMDYANELMKSIPRKLTSRDQMIQATETQEQALVQLKEAETLINRAEKGSADHEKQLIANNIKTSEQNLRGLKNALK